MKGRKKDAPPAEAGTTTTPFFARFLEGQEQEEDAEAKVSARRGRAQATAKSKGAAKKSGGAKKSGAKKSAGKKSAAAAKFMTLKYPSDRDEYVLYPYHVEAARVGPGAGAQTLKYPSDNDEYAALAATYADKKDVPKTALGQRAQQKFARIDFTSPSKDIDEAG